MSPLGPAAVRGDELRDLGARADDPGRGPARSQRAENHEQKIHPLYAYLYITDRDEGLILVNAATLLDGNPDNNFLERARLTDESGAEHDSYNPHGILTGARDCFVAGENVLVCCDKGVVVVSVADPLKPRVVAIASGLKKARSLDVQLMHAFVCDDEGVAVVDLEPLWQTDAPPAKPLELATVARVPLKSAHSIYLSRALGYVAAGADGLVVLDLAKPREPAVLLSYKGTPEAPIDDARDVKVGMTNASQYAYVADGKNGLRVIQLTSPDDPLQQGWCPLPSPRLIATRPTSGPALAVSAGVDRDRAVDESGHQIAVFGRIGSRPFDRADMRRILFHADGTLLRVEDDLTKAGPHARRPETPVPPGETLPLTPAHPVASPAPVAPGSEPSPAPAPSAAPSPVPTPSPSPASRPPGPGGRARPPGPGAPSPEPSAEPTPAAPGARGGQ